MRQVGSLPDSKHITELQKARTILATIDKRLERITLGRTYQIKDIEELRKDLHHVLRTAINPILREEKSDA